MAEIERLNTALQIVSAKLKSLNRWWEEQAIITDELIRDTRAYIANSEVYDVRLP